MEKNRIIRGILASSLFVSTLSATCINMVNYEITTGSKKGTYYQIGKNLAKYVAPESCINLKVLNSNGSMDNLKKLNSYSMPNLKFAIVQHDVFAELKRLAKNGDKDMKKLVGRLRVVKALYDEEIHILANADSNITTFADLKGKKISVGKVGSGTAMTSSLLYTELFGSDMTEDQAKFEKFGDALDSLDNKSVDAIITVAGQPVSKLAEFTENANNFIKLIRYDERGNQGDSTYYPTEIVSSSYTWLDSNVETLSTKAYLITFNYKGGAKQHIKEFSRVLNEKIRNMQNNATAANNTPHLKWKQVPLECDTRLPGGWEYYSATKEVCNGGSNSSPTPSRGCTPRNKALGRCQ